MATDWSQLSWGRRSELHHGKRTGFALEKGKSWELGVPSFRQNCVSCSVSVFIQRVCGHLAPLNFGLNAQLTFPSLRNMFMSTSHLMIWYLSISSQSILVFRVNRYCGGTDPCKIISFSTGAHVVWSISQGVEQQLATLWGRKLNSCIRNDAPHGVRPTDIN